MLYDNIIVVVLLFLFGRVFPSRNLYEVFTYSSNVPLKPLSC